MDHDREPDHDHELEHRRLGPRLPAALADDPGGKRCGQLGSCGHEGL